MEFPSPFEFEWDKGNLEKNWVKHKVHFREAEEIFLNSPLKIFPDKKHSIIEGRFQALGITNNKRKLSVHFIVRNNKVRVISARSQNKKEKIKYAEKKA